MVKTVVQRIRDHLLQTCGFQEAAQRLPSYEELRSSEWSEVFERYMRNRLIMGALHYGLMYDTTRECYDYVGGAVKRLRLYLNDGNQEHLVDAANCCLLEFVRKCCHPSPKFRASDDDVALHIEVK